MVHVCAPQDPPCVYASRRPTYTGQVGLLRVCRMALGLADALPKVS
jgi:hypothetical protein